MDNVREGPLFVLYDGQCGFCQVVLALLLRWDRANRLAPEPIESAGGEELLVGVTPVDRLKSWHLVDADGVVHSGGAAIPLVFATLPHGAPIAYVASQFPRTTARAYGWVAAHRVLLGRLLNARPRAWAARIIAERRRFYDHSHR